MDTDLRRQAIREQISKEGYARLSDLSEQYGVAPVTIHRDLDHLMALGQIERTRGGARPADSSSGILTDYEFRRQQAIERKQAIAQRALLEVPDGGTIFLDSSTTSEALGMMLGSAGGPSLTVVTNSSALAFRISAPNVHLIVTPGEVDQQLRAITGRWTVEFISTLNIDVAFVSAAGVTEAGLMTTQRELAELIKAAFAQSARHIALVDSSKFDVSALIAMADLPSLDLLITDDELPPDVWHRYAELGLNMTTLGAQSE